MSRYIVLRLANMIPILLGITFCAFVLISLSPSDPAEVALRVNDIMATPEVIEQTRQELGLDKPFLSRYVTWLGNSLRGDFGISYANGRPVLEQMLEAFPPTLELAAAALLLTLLVSCFSGIVCALYQDGVADKVIRGAVFLGTSFPPFWAALLLMWLFAVQLDLFPTSGRQGRWSIVLPAVTLALSYISTYTRLIRAGMIKTGGENFILYARLRGLGRASVVRLMFLSSLQSTLTGLGMSIPKLIAGAVVVESIFAWPGVGRLCITAIFNRDFPVIQAYILCMAVLFVVCAFLSDVLNAWLDPRLREQT